MVGPRMACETSWGISVALGVARVGARFLSRNVEESVHRRWAEGDVLEIELSASRYAADDKGLMEPHSAMHAHASREQRRQWKVCHATAARRLTVVSRALFSGALLRCEDHDSVTDSALAVEMGRSGRLQARASPSGRSACACKLLMWRGAARNGKDGICLPFNVPSLPVPPCSANQIMRISDTAAA